MTTGLYAGLVMCYKLFTNSATITSQSKGTRKGVSEAKVGHRYGLDFSMGYWTEQKINKKKFCYPAAFLILHIIIDSIFNI